MLSPVQKKVYAKLKNPQKVQDFLDTLAINFELDGETCMGPRRVLETRRAHCMEGAMLAASILRFHGHQPLVLDLRARRPDNDHVVALFRIHGYWGAISKTNHAVLRYREPIYKTVRELALSYFHEYFDDNGRKNLREYSRPVLLSRFDRLQWETTEEDVWDVPEYLDKVKHYWLLTKKQERNLRSADALEIAAGKLVEWKMKNKKTSPH